MPSKKGIEAGKAFIRFGVDSSDVPRALNRIQARISDAAAAIGKIGVGLAGGGLGIVAPLINAADAAGDVQEVLNRFGAVFGDQSEAAGKFADTLANDVGRSAVELKSTLSDFQGLTLGLGFEPAEARRLSETLTSLSLDLASFNNLTDADASGRFLAALTGSSEVLDRFGINLKVAAINQKLLADGINPASATEAQKTLARLSIITESLGKQGAIGDAITTADSYANSTKRLTATLADFRRSVGKAVLPVLAPLVRLSAKVAGAFKTLADENPDLIRTTAKVGAVLVVAGGALAGLAGAALVLPTIIGALGTAFGGLAAVALPAVAAGLAGLAIAALPLKAIFNTVAGVARDFGRTMAVVVAPVGELFTGLASDVKAAVGDVVGALAAGDVRAAGALLFANLRVAFETGQLALLNTWGEFRTAFLTIGADAFLGVARIAIEAVAAIGRTFNGLKATLANIFTEIGGQIEETFGLVKFGATVAANKARAAFDDEFDADAANAGAAEQLRQTVQGNVKGERQARQQIEDERRAADNAISETVASLTDALTEGVDIFKKNVQQDQSAALDVARRELAEASEALAALRSGRPAGESGGGLGNAISELIAALSGSIAPAKREASTAAVSARGIFNASNLQSLLSGGDRVQQSIEKNTKKAAEESRRTRQAIERGPSAAFV